MKRTVSFIIFMVLFNMFCLTVHAEPVGKFTKVEGRVDITSPGASARPVSAEDEVSVGDIVRVKSKSKAEIVFLDGGILRIAQKSRVKINEYIVGKEQRKGIFSLFRGKIENVVKKSGGIFGFNKKNKQEVHTPTAVCGVRGTDFFSIHQRGISNFIFKEGQGYGYSKNQPDKVMNINAGQAMVVVSPSIPPIIRKASVNEITRHSSDTAVKDKEKENKDQDKKNDKQIDNGSGDGERDDKVKENKSGDDESRNGTPADEKIDDDKRSDAGIGGYKQTEGSSDDNGSGEYGSKGSGTGETPSSGGDKGAEGSSPDGYVSGGTPSSQGDYGALGLTSLGDFYAGDIKSNDYWSNPGDGYFRDGIDNNYWGEILGNYSGPDIAYDIEDYIPGFRVDNISISGNSGISKYDLAMSGIYNWIPPFVYIHEDIKGELTGNLKRGYFLGFTGCGWNKYEQRVDGTAAFFYVATDATGGLLLGDVSGYYYTDSNTWSASSSLDFVELGSGLSVPNGVKGINDYARDTFLVSGSGDFYDLNSNDIGNLNMTKSSGIFDSVEEAQYWGYWRTKVEGSYSTIAGKSKDDFDHWSCEWEQRGLVVIMTGTGQEILGEENLRLYMSSVGGSSHYTHGEFESDAAGGWVDIEHAVTGVAVGELHGEYDPSGVSTEIFAASGGVWLETGQLLAMANSVDGRANLSKLGIPGIEIGKATLTGSYNDGGNGINVTMTDVTFLAHQSGGEPRIWATDSVTGTYAGTPSTAWTVALNQAGGTNASNLTADFKLRTWDTNSNKWAATVNGSGQVGSPLKDITFKGGAGGNIDTPAAGHLSGTAAGWSK